MKLTTINPQNKIVQKGSCKTGDKVFCKGRPILVRKVIDYCPELRKSYIIGCLIDSSGRALVRSEVLAGYDWSFKKRI